MKGYVYILSNEFMPGLLKIGKTKRSVEQRAGELYQTGVPVPFKVEHEALCHDCDQLEIRVHEELREFRVSESREFFKASLYDVIGIIDGGVFDQVQGLVDDYLFDHRVIESDYITEPSDVADAISPHGLHPIHTRGILAMLTADELAPAVERYTAEMDAATKKRKNACLLYTSPSPRD